MTSFNDVFPGSGAVGTAWENAGHNTTRAAITFCKRSNTELSGKHFTAIKILNCRLLLIRLKRELYTGMAMIRYFETR